MSRRDLEDYVNALLQSDHTSVEFTEGEGEVLHMSQRTGASRGVTTASEFVEFPGTCTACSHPCNHHAVQGSDFTGCKYCACSLTGYQSYLGRETKKPTK